MTLVSKAHAVLTSLLALVLLQPSFAQTGKVAIIHTEEFFHPERGIKRLIRALKELDQDFYSRPFEAQEKQFLEIDKVCFPEGLQKVEGRERVKEIVCPVLEDVSKRAEMFAKKRKIRQLVDIHDEVGLFKVGKVKDVTREFINEYNYRNPWPPQSNKRLQRTRHERASLLGGMGEPLKRSVRRLKVYLTPKLIRVQKSYLESKAMTAQVSRSFEYQLVGGLLFLLLFSAGIAQLFFIHEIRKRLLGLRQSLERIYERHPILLKVFGPPLKTLELKGYTVGKRIGGVILIIISIVVLISVFQPPEPCGESYWSITRPDPC
jgi:hypothetical protein